MANFNESQHSAKDGGPWRGPVRHLGSAMKLNDASGNRKHIGAHDQGFFG